MDVKELQKFWYLQGYTDKEQGNPMQFVPDQDDKVCESVRLSPEDLDYIMKRQYENGREDMKKELLSDAIHCSICWHDGPYMNYTQEQQDDVLEKIGALDVDTKVMVIILKDEDNNV